VLIIGLTCLILLLVLIFGFCCIMSRSDGRLKKLKRVKLVSKKGAHGGGGGGEDYSSRSTGDDKSTNNSRIKWWSSNRSAGGKRNSNYSPSFGESSFTTGGRTRSRSESGSNTHSKPRSMGSDRKQVTSLLKKALLLRQAQTEQLLSS